MIINVKNKVYIQVSIDSFIEKNKIQFQFLLFSMCESITLVYKLFFCINICGFFYLISFLKKAIATSAIANFKGSPLAKRHAHFSSGCDFMMVLGKSKPHTKFEVANFSTCRNIKGNPKILESSHSPGQPTFLCDFTMGLGDPQLQAIF